MAIKDFDPGQFTHKIEIQEQTSVKIDGFLEESWVTVRRTRALIRPPSMKKLEFYAANGENSINLLEFIFRYTREFNSKARVIYKGKIYELLKGENYQERNKYTILIGKVVE